MTVSPIHIEFMLACYVTPAPGERIGRDEWESGAGHQVRKWLAEQQLIDSRDRATPKGEAWVKFICATPLPEQRWVLPARDSSNPIETTDNS